MKKNIFIFHFILCIVAKSHGQQRFQNTQYMFTQLVLNPAYAGTEQALSMTAISRKQWIGTPKAPSMQTFALHGLSQSKRVGFGFVVENDKLGAHKNLTGSLVYAYHIETGRNSMLSLGMQAGFINLESDYSSLVGSANDPAVSGLSLSQTMFTFGSGVYFRTPRFSAGLSAPALLDHQLDFSDTLSVQWRATNIFLFSSYTIPLSTQVDFMPAYLLKYYPGVPFSFDLSTVFTYRRVLSLGLAYREKESVDMFMKIKATPVLTVGYGYDHPIGTVSRLSNGSHELMLNLAFKTQTRPREDAR